MTGRSRPHATLWLALLGASRGAPGHRAGASPRHLHALRRARARVRRARHVPAPEEPPLV